MKKNFIQKNKQQISKVEKRTQQKRIQKPITMPQKIKYLQNKVSKLEQVNPIQSLILQQMKKIKQQLHELKVHLRNSSVKKIKTNQSIHEEDDNQNIHNINSNNSNKFKQSGQEQQKSKKFDDSFKGKGKSKKQLIHMNKIQPFLKDYKIQGNQIAPYYIGYNKKTMKPVIIKYSNQSMKYQVDIYNKLWKNIVKARWPCINKIYQIKEVQVNVMILDKNIVGIRDLPYNKVLIDILNILEFIHQNGYLYRNIQPEHFMLNQNKQLVVIDFKNARRYLDHKNNHIEVVQQVYNGGDFGSNNQLRHMAEGRKDDLESLGYLALFLLQGQIPWQGMTRDQMIKSRNNLTLQQLYRSIPRWLQYMILVHKMSKNQKPDYEKLINIIDYN